MLCPEGNSHYGSQLVSNPAKGGQLLISDGPTDDLEPPALSAAAALQHHLVGDRCATGGSQPGLEHPARRPKQ